MQDVRKAKTGENILPALPPARRYCVLSSDQGAEHCGIAIVHGDRSVPYTKTLELEKYKEHSDKRTAIVEVFLELIAIYHPDRIVFEGVRLFSTNKRSGKLFISRPLQIVHDRMIGAVIDATHMVVVSIGTQDWKYHVLSNRTATKEYTASIISTELRRPVDEHSADAVCLGYAAFNRRVKQYIEA